MCGIIGVIGERNATPVLMEGLKRLEYRGYDSAGIALAWRDELVVVRALGKLVNLERALTVEPRIGFVGIGHTRWATHGAPTERNAHPHCSANVAVVHNGIIENHPELKAELLSEGVEFTSETDTEVIPHLIERELRREGDPEVAVRRVLQRLEGAFALGILLRGHDEVLYAARRGSPLLIGLGEGENFIASDATPLVPYTRRMVYLNDNDFAILTRDGVRLTDFQGSPVVREVKYSQVSADLTDKWPYRHYMQKEIFEQPTAIGETLKQLIRPMERVVALEALTSVISLGEVSAVSIIACGTSWHAGLVARYWIEQLARIPTSVEIASEYRYREPPLAPGGITVVISQSGETADTLAALRYAKGHGQKVVAIVNVAESSIARAADVVLLTQAGPEIGVASTKAFTTQLVVLAVLALGLGRARGEITEAVEKEHVEQLVRLPGRIERVLARDREIQEIAAKFLHARGFLFLGRGSSFPIALEGALKLKEISYIHAEGYAAGEMKHGPIALIDEELPVVVVAPRDRLFDKVLSNLEEARARGGRLVVVTNTEVVADWPLVDDCISVGECEEFTAPMLTVVPLQLLAYHIAVLKGTDVDQPRNLAKSVTVE
ncbi:MAG: glutamine--fructose-6-phosphate transaminase (isomerizing) [Magnetococcales bacterium]|nr:glutamine--fructose-6-phosphate transaminase (isomerizing) [Magnetococcales bacterium]MBF0156024.1 glutamine--fructose-6-phosphate transaminase (isomerizing) [Magnetococcales bacterium]